MLTFVYTANAIPEHLGGQGDPGELPGGRVQGQRKWAAGSLQPPKDLLGGEVSICLFFLVEYFYFFPPFAILKS